MSVLIATTNPGKAKEFGEMLGGAGIAWKILANYPPIAPVEETGATFRANACLKASGYAKAFSTWTIADDSGLAVDALDGKPGVHSARWAAMHDAGEGDAANNALLLRQLENVEESHRGARFVCVLALADPQGNIVLSAMDHVEGRVLRSARGDNGFGYDPLFFYPPLDVTTAELPPEKKHAISHRGNALRRLQALIAQARLAARMR
jgi:XTP/dITP diphosphohydrolase